MLAFIIEQTLCGKQHQIKEYTIALEVLKKKSDFNPQLDAIVRIHAGRLRKALAAYYSGMGLDDPVIISVPRGSYVPVFMRRTTESAVPVVDSVQQPATKSRPVLAVLPFTSIPANHKIKVFAHVLSSDLSVELTKFKDLGIISFGSTLAAYRATQGLDEIAKHLGADCLISGSIVKMSSKLKITIDVYMPESNVELWADSFQIWDEESTVFSEMAKIIRKVIGVITGHYGIVYRHLLTSDSTYLTKDFSHANAVYLYHQYHQRYTPESILAAIDTLEDANNSHPDHALIIATLGTSYVNLKSAGFDGDFDPLETGLGLLNRAIGLDPHLANAHKAHALGMILKHNAEACRNSLRKALEINPNDVFVSGDSGFGYICIGDYEKGLDLILEAVHLNPYYPWFYNVGFCLYYLSQREVDEALFYAQRINRPEYFLDSMLQASLLGWLGKKKDASLQFEKLLLIMPDFTQKAKKLVGLFILDDDVQTILLEGLKKAGLEVDPTVSTKIRHISPRVK